MTTTTTPIIITNSYIRALIVQRYGGKGGCSQLARDLAVSHSTASALRRGEGGLDKPAALFGYSRDGEFWKTDPSADVDTAGYKRWTPERLDYVRGLLFFGKSRQYIADDLQLSRRQLNAVIKDHRLDDHSVRTPEEIRRDEAERKARARGGSLSEITAYMSMLLSTPAQNEEAA